MGIPLGILFLCFAILSIPAMITVLAVTDNLISALNPLIFVKMAWRIGWGYLLMYTFLLLLLLAPATVGYYIVSFLPKGLHVFLSSFTKSYYTIISYHLMGYVMLQYHEEIGWEVDFDDDLAEEYEESEGGSGNELLNRVDMMIKDGQIDEAIALIKEETEGHITDLALAERYYKLLKVKQQVPEILQHSKNYLDLLIKKKDSDKVCQVYSECVSTDNQFSPTPTTLFKIGGLFNEKEKPKEAINAYNRFIKANPSNPLIPKAYFLCANILNEKLNATQKAAQILHALIKKYPNHDMIPHIRKYLKGMAS
jgi:tetratricopeptide (TPR) repeat protein